MHLYCYQKKDQVIEFLLSKVFPYLLISSDHKSKIIKSINVNNFIKSKE